jgi:hypothetical protein
MRCIRGRFPVMADVQSGTSSARSSSRSAAATASSFDLRNVRPVLRYLEDLFTLDH